ncbi:hypothetical protein HanXRQr2_Chr14g0622091 [Helianthus annuus]|uniref:Uncharacterized protein n=1 Tax=Helianthus annuus TaxID=4232 RepID=A0A9K3H4M1_HELAN|nr:hypothetical protein HanXRQr2_Chr14g0622091 [Helianthus annuus]
MGSGSGHASTLDSWILGGTFLFQQILTFAFLIFFPEYPSAAHNMLTKPGWQRLLVQQVDTVKC